MKLPRKLKKKIYGTRRRERRLVLWRKRFVAAQKVMWKEFDFKAPGIYALFRSKIGRQRPALIERAGKSFIVLD